MQKATRRKAPRKKSARSNTSKKKAEKKAASRREGGRKRTGKGTAVSKRASAAGTVSKRETGIDSDLRHTALAWALRRLGS
jgi:hypothetical protein